ncbi:metal ABC transporter permease [Paracoccus hibiscisoli]|uniref:Metal ABC transporter permease n=1 Tax=Paracoccus hibiscisoli TaxID=2023261 RepID=A0A4V5MTZ7_9RHOB|nr:metal ABC transporter permease [Paracoccus hibiscisoli]TJZ86198.1 metal ABC transporter permease [Paracoccus hibiscisoli]
MNALILPFSYPLMADAAMIAVIVAIPAALLSCFLVLKGWALMGDGISHAVLPGIVLAYAMGLPLLIGAFIAGMICALSAGWLDANSRIKPDTALGVVMAGLFAFGLILFTLFPPGIHLDHILFGNILGIGPADFAQAAPIALAVSAILLLKWRDFALLAFDPVQARVSGLATNWLHYGMLAMIAASVVAMLSAVGIILAVGLLIAPGAIAFLLTRRLAAMMALATATAVVSSLAGIWTSFWLNSAPAPTIIVILTALFVLAFGWRQLAPRP